MESVIYSTSFDTITSCASNWSDIYAVAVGSNMAPIPVLYGSYGRLIYHNRGDETGSYRLAHIFQVIYDRYYHWEILIWSNSQSQRW